jgi:nicotinate-nucleotide pyrophosphorylase (carboxylating)
MTLCCTNKDSLQAEVSAYLDEDIGTGDITANIISEIVQAEAVVITREEMVVCGQSWFDAVFRFLGTGVNINWQVKEGEVVGVGATLCELSNLPMQWQVRVAKYWIPVKQYRD